MAASGQPGGAQRPGEGEKGEWRRDAGSAGQTDVSPLWSDGIYYGRSSSIPLVLKPVFHFPLGSLRDVLRLAAAFVHALLSLGFGDFTAKAPARGSQRGKKRKPKRGEEEKEKNVEDE